MNPIEHCVAIVRDLAFTVLAAGVSHDAGEPGTWTRRAPLVWLSVSFAGWAMIGLFLYWIL